MNKSEVISEIRACARRNGLTFKVNLYLNINNEPSYMFIDRTTKEIVLTNCTLGSAYNDCCSGYIDSYVAESAEFAVI